MLEGIDTDWHEVLNLLRNCDRVAFFEAYFDESGTHSTSPMTVVGGILATQATWITIGDQWLEALSEDGIECFHAADLNSYQGEFKGWSETRRRRLYQRLAKTFEIEPLQTIGVGINHAIFNRVMSEFPTLKLNPYQLGVLSCFGLTHLLAHVEEHVEKVGVVFEGGRKRYCKQIAEIEHRLVDRAVAQQRYKIVSLTFGAKTEFIPLQMADWFAYECFRFFSVGGMESEKPIRFPLKVITDTSDNHVGAVMSEEHMRGLVESIKQWGDTL